MKTHELARTLRTLAALLSRGPDIEISELTFPKGSGQQQRTLNFLPEASTKRELVDLIARNQLPIEIHEKDGADKVLRKLERLLERDPALRNRVKNDLAHAKPSAPLLRVFESLLGSAREK
jgi:hypothetical protein